MQDLCFVRPPQGTNRQKYEKKEMLHEKDAMNIEYKR